SRLPIDEKILIAPECDLAVLVVKPSKPLVALPLAPKEPKKGEPIVAFGSPAGLSFSISEGSVSGLRTAGELDDLREPFQASIGLEPSTKLVRPCMRLSSAC
ncbi:MAG: trypsin-like peptidase domain-containing protein, partial [Anaerolineae bacterium]|nr:trypsin-like peptidase domain-containing protein [Anaerolineae bacterium]